MRSIPALQLVGVLIPVLASIVLSGCTWTAVNGSAGGCCPGATADAPYAMWPESLLNDPNFFPIAVWAQDTALAAQYKALGVNTYMALWEGPTEKQLADLAAENMVAICAQNEVGLANLDNPVILAWMHGDEPDNRQSRYDNGPVPLAKTAADYAAMIARDPSRPVLVNFGQGVANEQFAGRALSYDRYPAYTQAADILSYDVYPVANIKYTDTDENGRPFTNMRDDGGELLWYVAEGIDRLRRWSGGAKPVWNVLECTAISHPRDMKVTPHQMRAEFWMSIVHGSRGICWFCHDFREGHRNAAAILSDETLKAAMRENNLLATQLAPVINSPSRPCMATVATDNETPVDILTKKYAESIYIFAVAMRNSPTTAYVTVDCDRAEDATVEVIGEDRTIAMDDDGFSDSFDGFGVHIYKIPLNGE